MKSFIIKTKRIIKEGIEALRFFNWRIAKARIECICENDSVKSIQNKNKAILSYLKKDYKKLIEQYNNKTILSTEPAEGKLPIWVFWLQGEKEMPEMIRVCQYSKIAAAGNHPLKFLDQYSIKEYVSFPEEVWDRVSNGQLKVQHLADMIRVQLIRKYGGLWLDASIFCHRPISEQVFSYPLYSLKGEYMPEFVSGNQWTTFLIGGHPDNILCSFLDDFFQEWIKSGKPFIDYFMFDCAIALAYENIPEVKKEIEDLPKVEGDYYWLNNNLAKPLTSELLREYNAEPSKFYKIGWNRKLKAAESKTLYDYLVERSGQQL